MAGKFRKVEEELVEFNATGELEKGCWNSDNEDKFKKAALDVKSDHLKIQSVSTAVDILQVDDLITWVQEENR